MEKLLLSWARVNVNTPAVHVRVGPLRRKGFGLYSSLLFHSSGIGTRRSGGRKRTARIPSGLTRKICGQWCTALLHEFSLSLSLFLHSFIRLIHKYPGCTGSCARRASSVRPASSSSWQSPVYMHKYVVEVGGQPCTYVPP